jgi:hypothetical protein
MMINDVSVAFRETAPPLLWRRQVDIKELMIQAFRLCAWTLLLRCESCLNDLHIKGLIRRASLLSEASQRLDIRRKGGDKIDRNFDTD